MTAHDQDVLRQSGRRAATARRPVTCPLATVTENALLGGYDAELIVGIAA